MAITAGKKTLNKSSIPSRVSWLLDTYVSVAVRLKLKPFSSGIKKPPVGGFFVKQ